jgi:lauroyl/myristoyl acyltransferase
MLDLLVSNSWKGFTLEFIMFIGIVCLLLGVVYLFVLPIGIFCGVCFLLGVVVEKIHTKREELARKELLFVCSGSVITPSSVAC